MFRMKAGSLKKNLVHLQRILNEYMEDAKERHYESPATSVAYLELEGIICNTQDNGANPTWNDPFEQEKGW